MAELNRPYLNITSKLGKTHELTKKLYFIKNKKRSSQKATLFYTFKYVGLCEIIGNILKFGLNPCQRGVKNTKYDEE